MDLPLEGVAAHLALYTVMQIPERQTKDTYRSVIHDE